MSNILKRLSDKASTSAHQHAIYQSGYEPLFHEAAMEIERLTAALTMISEGPKGGHAHKDNGGWNYADGPVSVARNALSGKPIDELY